MILDYFIKNNNLYKTFIILSIVHSIIIINSHLFKDYFNKDKDKKILSILYFIHIITIFISTFIISFVSYIMCFYLFGYSNI